MRNKISPLISSIDETLNNNPNMLKFHVEDGIYFGDFILLSKIITKKICDFNSNLEDNSTNEKLKKAINELEKKAFSMLKAALEYTDTTKDIIIKYNDFINSKNALKKVRN